MEPLEPSQGRTATRALLVLEAAVEARRLASHLEEHGIEAIQVADDQAGYNLLDTEQVDTLICETRAPRIDGLRLLRVARMRNPDVCVILLAKPSDLDLATRAMEEGAHDFQTRPVNVDKILAVIRRGVAVQRLVGEMHEMARRLDRKFGFHNLIGNSASIVRVYNKILHICGVDVPVLILGESGTGRELVAYAIHHNSSRRNGPMVRLDCSGLDALFLEKEIFGEESDDGRTRSSRLDLAEGGTFVLDGIDELPPGAQSRLLRFLRDKEFEPVGGTRTRHADVRIVAIGPLDLREKVFEGRLRADLYDHLHGVAIEMPALRHRRRDIPLMVEHFIAEAQEESGKRIDGIKPAAMDRLVRYGWPGNVRELKSVIRGMVATSAGSGPLDLSDLPSEIRACDDGDEDLRIPLGLTLAEVERQVIEATLRKAGGDRVRTARTLGIGLRTLQRRLAQYGTSPMGNP